jgi:hypothetical protein
MAVAASAATSAPPTAQLQLQRGTSTCPNHTLVQHCVGMTALLCGRLLLQLPRCCVQRGCPAAVSASAELKAGLQEACGFEHNSTGQTEICKKICHCSAADCRLLMQYSCSCNRPARIGGGELVPVTVATAISARYTRAVATDVQ